MRRQFILTALLLALLCAGCGAEQNLPAEEPLPPETEIVEPEDPVEPESPEEPVFLEGESFLLILEAPLADGRTLTLKAVGKELENAVGVREVLVYDGETRLQTLPAYEAIEAEWGEGMAEDFYEYTECWSQEEVMTVLDMNFDGNADFGLFGWMANNTIPYYYWTWDKEAGQYRFACVLQGAELHPDTKELSSEYKSGANPAQYVTDYYYSDASGALFLARKEVRDYQEDPEHPVAELWTVREGVQVRPRLYEYRQEDLVLTRREVPVSEKNEDGGLSYFLEIWEPVDGELQLVSREPYKE